MEVGEIFDTVGGFIGLGALLVLPFPRLRVPFCALVTASVALYGAVRLRF